MATRRVQLPPPPKLPTVEHNVPAFLIGNGVSRSVINVEKLKKYGTVFACNAAYRDFSPHYLCASDFKMQKEIIAANYHLDSVVIFQHSESYKSVPKHENIHILHKTLCKPPNTGLLALWAACRLSNHRNIYFIGYDIKNPKKPKDGNIYKGTPNYDMHSKKVVKPKMWHQRISQLMVANTKKPNFNATRVVNLETSWVPEEEYLKGWVPPYMRNITYEQFVTELGEEIWAR